ncbi:unnamed protein product [Nezara viridula]|uniref:Reverse transcriptase domain-containing protein n=1 Tax=Nezara viridula TaxID=85310 RepID=A0A9P0DXE3_NEZVI|nr:unnamed protein product [Nezara viridula]
MDHPQQLACLNAELSKRSKSKGLCPWKLVFDELPGVLEEERFPATAFVDDLAVVVASNSRAGLKGEVERSANLVGEWCKRKRLKISGVKTQAILLKAKETDIPGAGATTFRWENPGGGIQDGPLGLEQAQQGRHRHP